MSRCISVKLSAQLSINQMFKDKNYCRGHEGTVYSLDAYWKSDEPSSGQQKLNRRQVAPQGASLGVITLVTGAYIA